MNGFAEVRDYQKQPAQTGKTNNRTKTRQRLALPCPDSASHILVVSFFSRQVRLVAAMVI
jgi:hypothetical protein